MICCFGFRKKTSGPLSGISGAGALHSEEEINSVNRTLIGVIAKKNKFLVFMI